MCGIFLFEIPLEGYHFVSNMHKRTALDNFDAIFQINFIDMQRIF